MKTNRSFTILKYNPEVISKESDGYWIRYIKRLVYRENNSFFAFISGKTGSGKTYSALWLCEKLDPEFNVDRICFDVVKFMDMIRNPKNYGLKRGSCILFDEISVTIDSKSSLSLINKILKRVFSTIRSRGYVIIGTSPFKSFLDKSVRILLYAEFKTLSIDKKSKKVILEARQLEFDDNANQGQGKLYRKNLRVAKNGKLYPILSIKVPMPSNKLVEDYEREKNKFQDDLYAQSDNEVRAYFLKQKTLIDKTLNKEKVSEEPLELTEKEVALKEYLEQGHTDKQAQEFFKVSKVQIWKRKKNIIKKGYSVSPLESESING